MAMHSGPEQKEGELQNGRDGSGDANRRPPAGFARPLGTAVSLTPTEGLEFGTKNVGVATPPKNVTVKKVGTSTVCFAANGIEIGGKDPAAFIISSTTCGTTLSVGATCTVSIEFKAPTTGTFRATLQVHDNAGASPQTVSLVGQAS